MASLSDSLISPALLRSAGLSNSSASTPAATRFDVTVAASEPTRDGQFRVQVSDGNRQLTLVSEKPLPPGTQLTLQLREQPGKPPELQVISSQAPGSASASPTPTSTAPLTDSLKHWINSRFAMAQTGQLAGQLASQGPEDALNSKLALNSGNQNSTALTNTSHNAMTRAYQIGGHERSGYLPFNNIKPLLAILQSNFTQAGSDTGQQLRQLAQAIPQLSQLQSSANIRSSLENSGMFFERKLASALTDYINSQSTANPRPPVTAGGALPTAISTGSKGLALSNIADSVKSAAMASSMTGASVSPGTAVGEASATRSALMNMLQRTANALPQLSPLPQPTLGSSLSIETAAVNPINPMTSGLESRIHQLMNSDLKALLLSAAARITHDPTLSQPTPNTDSGSEQTQLRQLSRIIQATLADLEFEQARSHPSSPLNRDNPAEWNIPLLYQHNQQFHKTLVHLEQAPEGEKESADKRQQWTLNLHFDLQASGVLDVSVSLSWPRISAIFWAEHREVRKMIHEDIQPLRQRLEELGSEVGELTVRSGKLPEHQRNQISQSMVDIHT